MPIILTYKCIFSRERIFSKYSKIHSKDRYKLYNTRIEKFDAVQSLYKSKTHSNHESNSNYFSSESENNTIIYVNNESNV